MFHSGTSSNSVHLVLFGRRGPAVSSIGFLPRYMYPGNRVWPGPALSEVEGAPAREI